MLDTQIILKKDYFRIIRQRVLSLPEANSGIMPILKDITQKLEQ